MSWWTAGLLLAAAAPAHAYAPGRAPLGARRALLARRAPPAAMLAEVDRAGWCERVENAGQLAVVFFYAPWCRNCKAVRPKLERIEREVGDGVSFFQANFKQESRLCYEEKVFTFPTVHFYLPGIGRVSRHVLDARNALPVMRDALARFHGSRPQLKLLKRLSAESLRPIVRYQEVVSALQGLAEMEDPAEVDASGFGQGLNPKKESARLRGMVESDELRLAQLEELFQSLDTDADGRLSSAELEAAAAALAPRGSSAAATLLEGLPAELGVDQPTFVSLMVDKAVHDFAAGERALLPAFEALDADGDGLISQAQLLTAIESFCNAMPDSDGCDIDHRPLRLAQAFDAFANAERLLDYERFVEMVGARREADECEVDAGGRDESASAAYLAGEMENMGERECFGEAVDEQGEDDPGCDAWFFGEDPTAPKKELVVDYAKLEALKAAGNPAVARRRQMEAEAEAIRARLAAQLPLKVETDQAAPEDTV